MPNHVTNILRIVGKDSEKVFKKIRGRDEGYIDFNMIVRMPEGLHETRSPATGEAEKILQECNHESNKVVAYLKENIEELLGDHSETIKNLSAFATCGYSNWYDWTKANWGTKWNAYDQTINEDGSITFLTAWSTPFPAMAALSLKYPEVTVVVEYADEDIGSNCGRYALVNGETIENYKPIGKEADKFARGVIHSKNNKRGAKI